MSRLADADVIFYNGLHLEGKMAEVFERMGGARPTVAVTDGIAARALLAPAASSRAAYDPHVWFDVRLWMQAVETRARRAGRARPGARRRLPGQRASAYLAELAELDGDVRAPGRRGARRSSAC